MPDPTGVAAFACNEVEKLSSGTDIEGIFRSKLSLHKVSRVHCSCVPVREGAERGRCDLFDGLGKLALEFADANSSK